MSRLFIAIAVLGTALVSGGFLWPEFLNLPSLLITLGGSVLVTLFSYSSGQLRELVAAVHSLFTEKRQSFQNHVDELTRLTRLYRLEGLRGLETQEPYLKDGFLRRGVSLLVDLQKEEMIRAKLERELAGFLSQQAVSGQILYTLGKLLPAFGLIGTLVGFVLLLRHVSEFDPRMMSSALSIAVLTTLYGAVLANVVVHPLAARLQSVGAEKDSLMRLTLEWTVLLARGESPTFVTHRLTALLAPTEARAGQKSDWGKVVLSMQR